MTEKKIRLLIADDEEVIRNGMRKYFELHSDRFERIFTAANGEEAIDIILKYSPDIMLLDIQMPMKNGIEVMTEAEAASALPKTIILSAYDEFKYAQSALKLGALDYILKPCRSSDILAKVYEIADKYCKGVEDTDGVSLEDTLSDNHIVAAAMKIIEEDYYKPLSLEDVAVRVNITPGYLSTLFKRNLDMGFIDYLNKIRVEHAYTYLSGHTFKTYEIAYKVGFNDEKYFYRVFKKISGKTPSEYRKTYFKE